MPIASGDEFAGDMLPANKVSADRVSSISDGSNRQGGFPYRNPDREHYLGGDVQRYDRLDLSLGPDPEQDIPDNPVDFYTHEFADDPVSIKLHQDLFMGQGAFDPLEAGAESTLTSRDLNPDVYAWGLKYAGYIPKDWGNALPVDLVDRVDELAAYIKIHREKGQDPKVHPLLLDALVEYPLQEEGYSVGYEAGARLDLQLPHLVRLYKTHHKEEAFYADVLKAQYRKGRRETGITYRTHADELAALRGEKPVHEPLPYDTMVTTRDEQLINRFIFDVTPPRYRKFFTKDA